MVVLKETGDLPQHHRGLMERLRGVIATFEVKSLTAGSEAKMEKIGQSAGTFTDEDPLRPCHKFDWPTSKISRPCACRHNAPKTERGPDSKSHVWPLPDDVNIPQPESSNSTPSMDTDSTGSSSSSEMKLEQSEASISTDDEDYLPLGVTGESNHSGVRDILVQVRDVSL